MRGATQSRQSVLPNSFACHAVSSPAPAERLSRHRLHSPHSADARCEHCLRCHRADEEARPTGLQRDEGAKAVEQGTGRACQTDAGSGIAVGADHDQKGPVQSYPLRRGRISVHGESVEPGTPATLRVLDADLRRNRLEMPKGFTSPEDPPTARVTVTRLWSEMSGRGIVASAEGRAERPALNRPFRSARQSSSPSDRSMEPAPGWPGAA